ncbi:hypothetical protein T05_4357, partial [Trichinella murrelli]
LYLTPLAFGAPTGGNALCLNIFGTLSTISSHYKIKKQDSGNDSVANPLQGETMGMQKVRIVSLSTKGVSKQDGIVEVPEETWNNNCKQEDVAVKIKTRHGILEVPEATDCSGITSVNKKSRQVNPVAVSSKYFCERHVSDHNLKIKKNRKEDLDERDLITR